MTHSVLSEPRLRHQAPFVKVCGVRTAMEALACADAGVDALGILVTESGVPGGPHSCRLDVAQAAALVEAVPESVMSVLLLHEVAVAPVIRLIEAVRPAVIQCQRPMPVGVLEAIRSHSPRLGIVKSMFVEGDASAEESLRDVWGVIGSGLIDAVLVDRPRGSRSTGHWSFAGELAERLQGLRVIVAGGLTSENVFEVAARTKAFGVDVMSGVSVAGSGWRDAEKIHAFVRAARGLDRA